jgi:hypothetical protein
LPLIVEEGLAEFTAIVEAAALQPGEAEAAENRCVHGSAKLAAKREGSFIESVGTVGTVALEGYKG